MPQSHTCGCFFVTNRRIASVKYFNISDTELSDKSIMQPKTIYLADYHPPAYYVDEIHLDFDLGDEETIVKSQMYVRRNRHFDGARDLILNGEELTLLEIKQDGNPLDKTQYEL